MIMLSQLQNDIKPKNIIFKENENLWKLTDLGLSKNN